MCLGLRGDGAGREDRLRLARRRVGTGAAGRYLLDEEVSEAFVLSVGHGEGRAGVAESDGEGGHHRELLANRREKL